MNTISADTIESAKTTEDKPGALVVVLAVTVVVLGVVVVVLVAEEKIEPIAASKVVGEKKAEATKVACVTMGSGSKEVKDSAEGVL